MTGDLLLAVSRILGSVALLVAVLWGVSRLARRWALAPELGRKLIHVALGLYCLAFPWIFDDPLEVTVTCALALAVFALARGRLRHGLGEGLHSVQRVSHGEMLFALSVVLLFWLQHGHFIKVLELGAPPLGAVLYVLPLVILTLCDAASALVGVSYGRKTFRVEEAAKSWEGVAVFVTTGWLASMITLLLFTDIGRAEVILLSFVVAVFGAFLEAASWRGLDNLFIPLGLYFVLSDLGYLGVWALAGLSLLFLLALLVLLDLTHRRRESRHLVAMFAVLFFLIAIFSGVDSLLMPVLAAGAYAYCATRQRPRPRSQDALDLNLVFVAIALIYYFYSHIAQVNMMFVFNVAFAALTAAIVARLGASLRTVGAALVVALAALSVRAVWLEGASPESLRFYGLACAGVVIVTVIAYRLRQREFRRPWIFLGSVSAVLGFAMLPLSP